MTDTSSFVSVIVATYRRGAELKRALESLKEQTYKAFEVIVVDDNDDSEWNSKVENIVNGFVGENGNISVRYIQNHPNLGSARTRNEGIKAAAGEYICFLDDDDIYLPGRIKNQLEPMRVADADYSITDLALFSEADRIIETRKREYITDTSYQTLLRCHLMHHITGTDTMMFKKEYLVKIGCFSPIDVGDEFYLMQKAIEEKGRFLYVPACDVKAYVHTGDGGLSSGQSKIDGENSLFEHKKKYFGQLDKQAVRYIKMRHHAVLAFAYLRTKKPVGFIREAFASFISSPISCVCLLLGIGG